MYFSECRLLFRFLGPRNSGAVLVYLGERQMEPPMTLVKQKRFPVGLSQLIIARRPNFDGS